MVNKNDAKTTKYPAPVSLHYTVNAMKYVSFVRVNIFHLQLGVLEMLLSVMIWQCGASPFNILSGGSNVCIKVICISTK